MIAYSLVDIGLSYVFGNYETDSPVEVPLNV